MEKKRPGGCKWNCRILQHSVRPKALQLVRLIAIGWAVRVMKWAVYWTDSVVAKREVATLLVPWRRSETLILRPSSEQLRNNCTLFVCFTLHMSVATVCGTLFGVNCSTVFTHDVVMCFLCIWEQTAITSLYSFDWFVFITETECIYCAVCSTFYILPTQCVYVFCVDLRANSDYFTVQHWLIGFYNRDGVFTARYVLHSTFCPHSVLMCFVCIWEQTAIISLYSIDWLVFIT